MENRIGIIREFRTKNFRVVVDALPDDYLDLSFDEDGQVAHDLEIGRLISFTARARVLSWNGLELASDYLGGCIYESLEAFADHRECGRANRKLEAEGDAGRCGSYFSDMVTNVCRGARVQYAHLQSRFASVNLRTEKTR